MVVCSQCNGTGQRIGAGPVKDTTNNTLMSAHGGRNENTNQCQQCNGKGYYG